MVVIPPEVAAALGETLAESANALRLLALKGEMSPTELDSQIEEMMGILNELPDELADAIREQVAGKPDAAKLAASENWKAK